MKKHINPTTINLSELPAEGRSYTYSRESGELNVYLQDLLGSNDYLLEFHVKPMGNAFEMKGKVKAKLDLLCSRCAADIEHSVDHAFNEILLVEDERPRSSQTSRANHVSELVDDGPFCNHLSSDRFHVGEFAHEIIALAEPVKPLGSPDCLSACENYTQALKEGWISAGDEPRLEDSPFSVLKQLKN